MHLVNRSAARTAQLKCPTRQVSIDNHERVIFYRLGTRQIFYDQPGQLLYFSDLEEPPVLALLENLCNSGQQRFVLELLFLDVNYYFFAGYRVKLATALVKPLLVALRLKGVHIEYCLPKANIDNTATPWFISRPITPERRDD